MKKHKVLIIEDDRDINELLCDVLLQSNFDVKSSYTGLDGFNLLKNNSFDIVLLDLMLPFKSGDSIMQELRTFGDRKTFFIS